MIPSQGASNGQTTLAPFVPSGYFYISSNGVHTDIPQDHLASFTDVMDVLKDMNVLYGNQCGIVPLSIGTFVAPDGGTLVYLGISSPIGVLYAATLATEKKKGAGTWGKDVNGGPQWNLTPITVPAPIHVAFPPGSFPFPGFGNDATVITSPVLDAIKDLKTYLVGKLGS